jgi:hypothetical protein
MLTRQQVISNGPSICIRRHSQSCANWETVATNAKAISNFAKAYLDLNDSTSALPFLDQHLVMARELGDQRSEARALLNFGRAHLSQGETSRALSEMQRGPRYFY